MIPSPEIVDFVAAWEGFRANAYLDAVGIWTIGYGQTRGVREGDTVTREEARADLEETLTRDGQVLQAFMTREPSQQQFDALLSLAYNCGVQRIGESGVMFRFNNGWDRDCADRILWWDKAGGRVLSGLHKRREAERAIYLDGDYSGRP